MPVENRKPEAHQPVPASSYDRTPVYTDWRDRYEIVGKIGAGTHQIDHPRIVAAGMADEGGGVRRQQLGDIRIQRVVGEEALRADGQQRDLDVEQRTVQTGDAVPAAGGPPSA